MSRAAPSASPAGLRPFLIRAEVLAPAFVLLITLLVYLRSLGAGFVYDDQQIIVSNPRIRTWSFVWNSFVGDFFWYISPKHASVSSYFRPLESTWLAVNYHLFGLDPVGWHAGIILLHLIAVWLLYRLARRLGLTVGSAAIAAALFGIAPVGAQAISWVAALSYPMCVAFQLAALLNFTNYEKSRTRRFGWSLAAFACALLTHEMAVVFPALIVAYVFLLEPSTPESLVSRVRRTVVSAAPFAALSLIYLALRLRVLGVLNRLAPDNQATAIQALLSVPGALWSYLGLLAMPWRSGLSHDFQIVPRAASPGFYLPTAGLVALGVVLYALLREHPRRKIYLFLLVWMGAAIAPALALRNYPPDFLIQDRYLYWSSGALFIMLSDLGAWLAGDGVAAGRLALAIALGAIVLFACVLWRVEGYWHDEVALFDRCLELTPGCSGCRSRLAFALQAKGDIDGAEREFKRTLELDPQNYATMYNLGRLHAGEGRSREAEEEIGDALGHMPAAPPSFYLEWAGAADAAGDAANADHAYQIAIKGDPTNAAPAAMLRAQYTAKRGDLPAADSALRTLTTTNPDYAPGWGQLASVVLAEGDPEQALGYIEHGLALAPETVRFHLVRAAILQRLGRDSEALSECRTVINSPISDPYSRVTAQRLASTIAPPAGNPP